MSEMRRTMTPAEESAFVERMQQKPAPPPDPARWDEMSELDLLILESLVWSGEEVDEYDILDGYSHIATLAAIKEALESLRREGYAAPYADTGLWAPAGKGIAVIEGWRAAR